MRASLSSLLMITSFWSFALWWTKSAIEIENNFWGTENLIGVEPNFLQLGQSVRTDHLACLCAEAHWFLHLFPELSLETQGNWEVGLMNDIWSILWHIYMFTSHGDNLLPSPVQSDWDLIMGFLPLRQKIPCRVFVSWQQVNKYQKDKWAIKCILGHLRQVHFLLDVWQAQWVEQLDRRKKTKLSF